ncbi:MAG: RDD family protein [Betaproteobacteria bacterium]|nr:MAG: RDD family protein [Betaproteobacteria bacterium]
MAGMSERAGVIRRLAASLYETLLLAALALVVGFALLPVLTAGPSLPALEHALPLLTPAAQALSFGCLFAAFGAYCAWGWSDGRRTLPMKTWRLAMESTRGAPLTLPRAALRYVVCWIGPGLAIAAYAALRPLGYSRWAVALLAVNYAWALVNSDRQFLQDRVAGTRLIVAS